MPGRIAAVARLKGCDLVRRRTRGNQDRTLFEPLFGPGQRAQAFLLARHHAIGIKMQHRHDAFGIGDLAEGRV